MIAIGGEPTVNIGPLHDVKRVAYRARCLNLTLLSIVVRQFMASLSHSRTTHVT